MKKCLICLMGSWTVGLAAVSWGVLALFNIDLVLPLWARVIGIVVGLTGIGFLYYQPPMKPCPRCVAANHH